MKDMRLPSYIEVMSASSPITRGDTIASGARGRVSIHANSDGKGSTILGVGDTQHVTFRLIPGRMSVNQRLQAVTFERTVCDGIVLFSRQAKIGNTPPAEMVSIIHTYPRQRPFIDDSKKRTHVEEIEPTLREELERAPLTFDLVDQAAQHHYPSNRRGIVIFSEPSGDSDPRAYAVSLFPLLGAVDNFVGEDSNSELIVTIPGREIQRRINAGESGLDADMHFNADRERRFITVPLTGDRIDL